MRALLFCLTITAVSFNVTAAPSEFSSSQIQPFILAEPVAVGVSPASGSGLSQSMTFTFTDAAGFAQLNVMNVLINSALDGSQACYLAYSQPLNTIYLVDDPGTGLLPGVTPGTAGTANNGHCFLSGLGSSVATSGVTLTLTLALDFSAGFGGHKIVFLAARDNATGNSGWQPLGTWDVPGPSTPPVAYPAVAPAHGTGATQTFTFTFTDAAGWQDIGIVNILINGSLDGRNACYLAYSRPFNTLYLVDDAGGSLLGGINPNGAGNLTNSQCGVSGGISSAVGGGNILTLTLSFQFQSLFAGNRVIYGATRTNGDALTSGWQAIGVWTVPAFSCGASLTALC